MARTRSSVGEFVYGIHSLVELLKAKRRAVDTVYTTTEPIKAWGQIERLIQPRTRLVRTTREQLGRLAGSTDHQGVVAHTTAFVYKKSFFDPKKAPFIVLLDRIQDPRNVGAIIRSAYCAGVDGVVIIDKGGVGVTPTVHKVSAGLAERTEIFRSSTVGTVVRELQVAGYTLYCGIVGGTPVQSVDFRLPCCIVVGNEGVGIASGIIAAGTGVMIPQRTGDISYNASVAAGILMFSAALKLGRLG